MTLRQVHSNWRVMWRIFFPSLKLNYYLHGFLKIHVWDTAKYVNAIVKDFILNLSLHIKTMEKRCSWLQKHILCEWPLKDLMSGCIDVNLRWRSFFFIINWKQLEISSASHLDTIIIIKISFDMSYKDTMRKYILYMFYLIQLWLLHPRSTSVAHRGLQPTVWKALL